LRSYVPVDGMTYPLKIGVEWPSRSGKMTYQGANFEAVEPPPVERILKELAKLQQVLKALPDGNPYLTNPGSGEQAQKAATPAAP